MKKAVLLAAMVFVSVVVTGCGCLPPWGGKGCAQPGETAAAGNRRHIRNARINHAMMLKDIDTFFLYDEPSDLTEYAVP